MKKNKLLELYQYYKTDIHDKIKDTTLLSNIHAFQRYQFGEYKPVQGKIGTVDITEDIKNNKKRSDLDEKKH